LAKLGKPLGVGARLRGFERRNEACPLLLTGLLPVRLNILVGIGAVDLLTFYGRSPYGGSLGPVYPLVVYCVSATWVVALIALGFAARRGKRWAFLAGMVLYGVDMIPLVGTFSLWAFGIHSFFVFKWFQGQRALKD